jgi:hypothetical protein
MNEPFTDARELHVGDWVLWTPRQYEFKGPGPASFKRPRYGKIEFIPHGNSWNKDIGVDFPGHNGGKHVVNSNQLETATHHPKYSWVDDDEVGEMLLAIYCPLDGEDWPCAGKRAHVTDQKAEQITAWRERRLERDRAHW